MIHPFGKRSRRAFLQAAAAGIALPSIARAQNTLYNGITIPERWPPNRGELDDIPHRPPYLVSPPPVIDIDIGRQLLVDDFLIQESTLYREFHRAEFHGGNPVLTPERPYEIDDPYSRLVGTPPSPTAMVFSDGVFYDPADRVFKMWYMAGYQQNTALATSSDGFKWQRPSLDVVRGTNIVSRGRDSNTVWLDLEERDLTQRYKMASYDLNLKALRLSVSRDGIHWRQTGVTGPCGDRSTFFFNPFRGVWAFSLRRDENGLNRRRRYFESRAFAATTWGADAPVSWVAADTADVTRPEMPGTPRQIYNLDAVAYESVMLGLFSLYRGEGPNREKPIDICAGFSRDGFHWSREWREPFIPVSEREGDWNFANVQSAGGCCVVVGDRLHFYVSGRQGVKGSNMPGVCSTGLATLRRDGFASLTDVWPSGVPRLIGQPRPGLTTRPVRFRGRYLFLNVDVTGDLRIEILDRTGRAIPGFTAADCAPITGNATRLQVSWKGSPTLERFADQPVRFRFVLNQARLYSFWVSPSTRGESLGYLAAGGPGYSGPADAG